MDCERFLRNRLVKFTPEQSLERQRRLGSHRSVESTGFEPLFDRVSRQT
jgi:hypothetical protein